MRCMCVATESQSNGPVCTDIHYCTLENTTTVLLGQKKYELCFRSKEKPVQFGFCPSEMKLKKKMCFLFLLVHVCVLQKVTYSVYPAKFLPKKKKKVFLFFAQFSLSLKAPVPK